MMEGQHSEATHASNWAYVKVALILAVITAVEIAVFYIDLPLALMITLLIVLSIVKFLLVAMYFMHLRFDSRLYTYFFAFGFAVSAIVAGAVIAMH